MTFRSDREALENAWIAGCAFAALLLLIGAAGWVLQLGLAQGTLVGYGIGALLVLVCSRGLYHRSIVSGLLLLVVALGPIVQGMLQWTMGTVELGPSVSVWMKGTVGLAGLGLSVIVIRAIYHLSGEERSQPLRHSTG